MRWAIGVNERTWLGSGGTVVVDIFSILVSYDFFTFESTFEVDFFFYGFAFNAFLAATATAYNFTDFAELSLCKFRLSLEDSLAARLFLSIIGSRQFSAESFFLNAKSFCYYSCLYNKSFAF